MRYVTRMKRLVGKFAIVTGGSSGIGYFTQMDGLTWFLYSTSASASAVSS